MFKVKVKVIFLSEVTVVSDAMTKKWGMGFIHESGRKKDLAKAKTKAKAFHSQPQANTSRSRSMFMFNPQSST